jgi:hypothetical protein
MPLPLATPLSCNNAPLNSNLLCLDITYIALEKFLHQFIHLQGLDLLLNPIHHLNSA